MESSIRKIFYIFLILIYVSPKNLTMMKKKVSSKSKTHLKKQNSFEINSNLISKIIY